MTKHELIKELNPGSREAIAAGCTCPVLDNHHGQGIAKDPDGNLIFWYSMDCKIHNPQSTKKRKAKEV